MNKHFLTGLLILVCLSSIVNECYAWPDPPVIYISDWYKWVALRDLSEEATESFYAVCSSGGPIPQGNWDWDYPPEAEDVWPTGSSYWSEITFWFSDAGRYEFDVDGENEYGLHDDASAVIYVVEVSMEPASEYVSANDDGDLVQVVISLLPSTLSSGKVTLEKLTSGSGNISVWYDSGGTNQVSLPVEWDVFRDMVPDNVWVKGTSTSSGSNDVTLRIRYKRSGSTVDEETADFTVVDVEMELEKVGNTTIEAANTYSENTTIRVTAVDADDGQTCSWFTGTVDIAEDGTDIYSQHTNKGATLPSSVEITSGGTTTFIAKSLADPIDTSTPPDPARIITTNFDVYNAAGYLSVEQWTNDLGKVHTDMSSGIVYDWFETRTKDIFDDATGDLDTVLSKMDYYDQDLTGDYRGMIIDWDHDATTAVHFNPHWEETRLDTDSGGYCVQATLHAHTNTVIHEARHCYQDYLSSVDLGQDDDLPGATPNNDDDQDWLVQTVPIYPNNRILDNDGWRGKCYGNDQFSGDATYDTYWQGGTRSVEDNVIERDAAHFADQND